MTMGVNFNHIKSCKTNYIIHNVMAVASGQAGWVFAGPLSHRLKVHMCTLSTHEGRTYKN